MDYLDQYIQRHLRALTGGAIPFNAEDARISAQRMIANTVRNGAVVLDHVRPGWHNDINVATLNIACLYNCVLGQLYGNWETALTLMPANVRECPTGYGFTGGTMTTRAWVELITERRLAEHSNDAPAAEKEPVNV